MLLLLEMIIHENETNLEFKKSFYNCFGRYWLHSEKLIRVTKIVWLVAVSVKVY